MRRLANSAMSRTMVVTGCLTARLGFVSFEIWSAVQASSLSLAVDALTHLSAGVSLVVTVIWAARPESEGQGDALDEKHGAALLILMGLLALEALRRIFQPVSIDARTIVAISLFSFLAHAALTTILARASRRAWLEGLAQNLLPTLLVPALTLGSGGLALATGWRWPDPIVSLVLLCAMGSGVVGLTIERRLTKHRGWTR